MLKWQLPGIIRVDGAHNRRPRLGPRTFEDLQIAVSQIIGGWRSKPGKEPGTTLMEQYCAAGYSQRAQGKYFLKTWGDSEVYQEVVALRKETRRGNALVGLGTV